MAAGFRVERVTTASPARLYDVLADVPTWREWAPFVTHSELIARGTPDPLGAGAVRRMGGFKVVRADEAILEARPPHYQRYSVTKGLPVSQHMGEMRIDEHDGGTRVIWTGSLEPLIPGTGWLLARLLRVAIARIADAAIRVAEEPVVS